MPFYLFRCSEHNTEAEIFCTMSKCPREGMGEYPECPDCGKEMARDFMEERGGKGCKKYGQPFVSQAMAISPDQIEEHGRLFPDVKVQSDGCITFDSVAQHDKYLKATGFHKEPQRIKAKGVRIDK